MADMTMEMVEARLRAMRVGRLQGFDERMERLFAAHKRGGGADDGADRNRQAGSALKTTKPAAMRPAWRRNLNWAAAITLALAVVSFALATTVFKSFFTEEDSAPAPVVSARETSAAATTEPVEQPAVASTAADVAAEPAVVQAPPSDLPEPLPESPAPVALPAQPKTAVEVPAAVKATFDAMYKNLGWDRIKTLRVKSTASFLPGVMTVVTDAQMRAPLSVYCTLAGYNTGAGQMDFYHITDGVFVEVGELRSDGRRAPTGSLMPYDDGFTGGGFPYPFLNDRFLNPKLYQAVDKAVVDPSNALFAGTDGAAPNRTELTVLRGKDDRGSFELYLDPETLMPVASRFTDRDGAVLESGDYSFSEVAEGVMYPVRYSVRVVAPGGVTVDGKPADEAAVVFETQPEDVVVNPDLDPSVFNFTMPVPR